MDEPLNNARRITAALFAEIQKYSNLPAQHPTSQDNLNTAPSSSIQTSPQKLRTSRQISETHLDADDVDELPVSYGGFNAKPKIKNNYNVCS
jgi:hypothetical protein